MKKAKKKKKTPKKKKKNGKEGDFLIFILSLFLGH